MNDRAEDEKSKLASNLLRQPTIAGIGLSLGIYIILVLAYFLTGQPAKFTLLLNWLNWSILFIPAVFASILGHWKISQHTANTPRLTFLILFYWMLSILSFSVLVSMLMMLELYYLLSLTTVSVFASLQTPSIFLVASAVTVIVWSHSAISIVLRPLMTLNVDGVSKSITGINQTNQTQNLGCLLIVMIGGILFLTLSGFISGGSLLFMLPFTILTEVLLALAAMSIYKIEERKAFLLMIIWLIPTLLVIAGIYAATGLITYTRVT